MRGRSPFGFDDMGSLTAGRLTGAKFDGTGSGVTVGATGGEATHILLTAELAKHSHTGTIAEAGTHDHGGSTGSSGAHNHGVNDPQHSHGLNFIQAYANAVSAGATSGGGSAGSTASASTGITLADAPAHTHTIPASGAHVHPFTGGDTGADSAHNTMPPFMVGTWFMVL